MDYRNTEIKVSAFINYVNEGTIKMPPFQRGRAWSLTARKKLIENIVRKKPIPAIFLYREATGEKYSYNILDGKQRLESLMLFVGNERSTLRLKNISDHFFDPKTRRLANYRISVGQRKTASLKDLPDELFRDFRDYNIPIIEITISEDGGLDDVISLFVDINSSGVKVKRFAIVMAMSKDPLFRSTFKLVAVKQSRKQDTYYKLISNPFTAVLKNLQIIDGLDDSREKVERAWELLVELFLFNRKRRHRTPGSILTSFMRNTSPEGAISKEETKSMRKVFEFLKHAYKKPSLSKSRLATNQIHFYTMITSIIEHNLIDKYGESSLRDRLTKFGRAMDEKALSATIKNVIAEYLQASAKHTTHTGVRESRGKLFRKAIEMI